MKIFSAFLISFVLVHGEYIEDDDTLVLLVRDLERRYYISCTTILYNENLQPRAFKIGKLMMLSEDSYGYVTVKSVRNYLGFYRKMLRRDCTRYFYLLLSDDSIKMREDAIRLLQSVTTSGTVWLIYYPYNVSIMEFFRPTNVAYDMDTIVAKPLQNGDFILSDVYRISMDHPVRVEPYGKWSRHEGLSTEKSEIAYYRRRQDLEGIQIKTVVMHNPPNHVIISNKDGKVLYLRGLFGSIWKHLERKLNFSSILSGTNSTGSIQSNHEWDGMIGMMLRDGIQVGVGEVTMSPERCAVFHCLRPIISTRNQLYFKETRERIQWDAILRPFHAETWTTILLWLLTSTACLNICYRMSRNYQLETGNFDFNFFNSLQIIYSALCQQGSSATPNSISCRVIFFMSYIAAAILFTVYSASLTSFLALQQPYRPFENLHQLLEDGSYILQLVRGSADHMYFSTATDPFSQEVYQKLIAVIPPEDLPDDKFEGLDRVCKNEKIVYFGSEFETRWAVAEINHIGKCKILSLENPLNAVYLTIILSKSSQFKDLFNYHLDALAYNGLLKRVLKSALEQMKVPEEEKFIGVGITRIFQIYLLLILGIFFSIIFFIIEKITYHVTQRRLMKTII